MRRGDLQKPPRTPLHPLTAPSACAPPALQLRPAALFRFAAPFRHPAVPFRAPRLCCAVRRRALRRLPVLPLFHRYPPLLPKPMRRAKRICRRAPRTKDAF